VTTLYDVVEEDGKPWLVLEHVDADSLQSLVEHGGPISPRAAARIGLDVLSALEAAHAAGIVHRDVKPANVLVQRDGHACLTDFGIATSLGETSLTTQGALIGSPSFMSPERLHGDEPAPPTDLWSLGATLYAAVEGRPPFSRGEPMATAMAVVSEDPAPMVRAGPLEAVVRGLLAKDPARRSTVAQAREGLTAVLAGAETPLPASTPPPPPPQPAESVHRFDAADLKQLAAASAAVLGSVARDARDQARHLAERRRGRKGEGSPVRARDSGPVPAGPSGGPPAAPRRRWRFKRRWVVVPVLVTVGMVLLVLLGVGLWLAHLFGQF
jgi:serine/threonine protein kinase